MQVNVKGRHQTERQTGTGDDVVERGQDVGREIGLLKGSPGGIVQEMEVEQAKDVTDTTLSSFLT